MSGRAIGSVWPSARPPAATPVLSWHLDDIAQLPSVRAEVRRFATAREAGGPAAAD